MVERSHTAGWLPQYAQAYAPLNRLSEKVADWFAPKADAGMGEITLELPGVAADDLQVLVQDGTLTVQGEKRFDRAETGLTYFLRARARRVPALVPPAA
ncbi:MAG: Hsp20/alpha crystallin family protein [Hyphomicrobiaceae bacterium]